MTVTRRLMAVAGGGASFPAPSGLPSDWGVVRHADNPLIVTLGAETHEMYVPAGLRLASGDIWVYVKGAARIYAWKSTDDGESFAIQGGGGQVVGPGAGGAWDNNFALEPTVLYDEPNGTIHLWYKGRGATDADWAWGHATAADSDPLSFTKDAGNPILTSATVSAALGGGTMGDLATGSVIKIGSTTHFYGYAKYDGTYQLIQATGSDWDDPSGVSSILSAGGGVTIVETPDVIKLPNGLYAMVYSYGGDQPAPRYVRAGLSSDGETWDFSSTVDILSPTGTGWEEDETYAGHFIKENAAPWAAPYTDGSGRWLFYYSGLEDDVAQSGLAYMTPT